MCGLFGNLSGLFIRTYLATHTPGNISADVPLQLSCGQLSWSMVLLICHPRMKRQMDLEYWNEDLIDTNFALFLHQKFK